MTTGQLHPSLRRLARANPAHSDDQRGQKPDAQAALSRILSTSVEKRRVHWRRSRRMMIVVPVATVLAAGAAFAATDPFGLLENPNRNAATFGVDSSRQVAPLSERQLSCVVNQDSSLACGPGLAGSRYTLIGVVQPPADSAVSRTAIKAAIGSALSSGRITTAAAQLMTADLATVSDSFLDRLSELTRYGTLTTMILPSGSRTAMVPPPRVAVLIVCEPSGAGVSCRDLNGDAKAALGSSIYEALPGPGWTPAPPEKQTQSSQLTSMILGQQPTAAERRLLGDLLTIATVRQATG